MIIDRIYIDNFGKLSNLEIKFTSGLNQIVAENGWGKTTLSVFLKVMFYGMPASRDKLKNERKKYLPWQGGNFGGSIEFTDENGKFRLTRYFGKTPESDTIELLNMDTNLLLDVPKNELGEEIFGIGKDTFEMTSFFPQLDFKASGNNQMSANILGLDKFNFDLANLTLAIDKIKKKLADSRRTQSKAEEITLLRRKVIEYNREILEIENKINQNKSLISKVEDELSDCQEKYTQLQKQTELQENLFRTKSYLESELYKKNEQLNSFLLQLEEKKKLEPENVRPKNKYLMPIILVLLGLFLIVDIVLFSLNIFKMVPMIIVAVTVFLVAIFVFTLLNKSKSKPKIIEREDVELEKYIENIKSSIEIIKSSLESYGDIEAPNIKPFEEMKERIFNKKLEKEKLINEGEYFKREYDLILDKRDNAVEEITEKENQMIKFDKDAEILNLTRDFLNKANENVSSRLVKPVNNAVEELSNKLDLRGRKFLIDTNFNIKEETITGIKELEYSSQGYQDILSFCMRKYLIGEIFKKERPFIVLDDTFVNLDDQNLNKIKDIVKDFAKENQIIYVCCNSRCKIN